MTLRVIVLEPEKPAYVKELSGDLESLQAVVGGYIELVPIPYKGFHERGLVVICNEDGISKQLPRNRGFLGTYFITRAGSTDEFESLTDKDVHFVMQELQGDAS
jgi:hypothetical protein